MEKGNLATTCCFTGHRPQSLPFGSNEKNADCARLKMVLQNEIERLITFKGITHFISGMAIGTDLMASQIVLDLKETYNNLTLEGAIPHNEQSVKWSTQQKEQYYNILRQCDSKTTIQNAYTHDCFRKRNLYMVQRSSYIIAVWNGKPSGTGQTVIMARGLKRHISIINPYTLQLTREN